MSTKLKVGIAGVAAVVVLMLAMGTTVFAQTPNPPATATPSPQQSFWTTQAPQTFWNTLASKLGVSVAVLQQDVRDSLKAVVAQALKNGIISQTQADNANSRIDNSNMNRVPFGGFGGRGKFGRGFGRGGFMMGQSVLNAAAQKLGMQPQDLMQELRSGTTLADVAKEKNVNANDLKAAIVSAVNAQIDQAVTNGKLTQSQADNLKSKVDSQIDLTKPFFMGRGGWGPKNFGPHNFGRQPSSTPQGTSG